MRGSVTYPRPACTATTGAPGSRRSRRRVLPRAPPGPPACSSSRSGARPRGSRAAWRTYFGPRASTARAGPWSRSCSSWGPWRPWPPAAGTRPCPACTWTTSPAPSPRACAWAKQAYARYGTSPTTGRPRARRWRATRRWRSSGARLGPCPQAGRPGPACSGPPVGARSASGCAATACASAQGMRSATRATTPGWTPSWPLAATRVRRDRGWGMARGEMRACVGCSRPWIGSSTQLYPNPGTRASDEGHSRFQGRLP
mmetsp:Transcript_20056/g.67386  ORF Transcript_20056/g.67386 Transcript_20056/m.67386 type:complete len:257 (+) Transcript_20056:418-1188(+)